MSPQINPYPRACPHLSSMVAPPLLGRVLSTAGPTQAEAELPAGPSLIVLCRPCVCRQALSARVCLGLALGSAFPFLGWARPHHRPGQPSGLHSWRPSDPLHWGVHGGSCQGRGQG